MPGEFSLIDAFLAFFGRPSAKGGVLLGPGDDCALTLPRPGMHLCTTVDAAVDGVHFSLGTFRDEEIGHKALAINLSDLAAMGAEARWFLCSIASPADEASLNRIPGIAAGMSDLARQTGTALIGGNFTRAAQLSIHITAMGEVPADRCLTRKGAVPGDIVFVSGCLGGASAALRLFRNGHPVPEPLRQRQCRPLPRLELGMRLRPLASAALDVSDGLLQDLGHLAEQSGVCVRLNAGWIPADPAVKAAGFTEEEALQSALCGGEDYELAFTVPEARADDVYRAAAAQGVPVTEIGRIVPGRGVSIADTDQLGLTGGLPPGFDHFR